MLPSTAETAPEPIAEPVPEPVPSAAPEPVPAPRSSQGGTNTKIFVLGGIVALVVLIFIAWTLITGGDEPSGTTTPSGSGTDTPSQTEDTESSAPADEPSAEGMEAFINDYLATAPTDPQTTFEQLTPKFQEASGGFGGYSGFWNTIESATLVEIDADPEAMTVAYRVDYVKTDGSEAPGDVVLGLVFRDGQYLIAREG